MASEGQAVEQLRDYLRTLKPEARAMLIVELERDLLRGEDVAGSELILHELRRTIRAAGQKVPRIGDAARLFFAPLEPFLINDTADHKRVGRIARASLVPIWEWMGRDLMPAETKALVADVNRALFEDDRLKAEQLIRALHDRAMLRVTEVIVGVRTDQGAQRRLAVQVGTPRAVETIATFAKILACRDILPTVAQRLPTIMPAFERDQIDLVKALLSGATAQRGAAATLASKDDVFLYGLVMVVGRLTEPWQLIRIATRAAASSDEFRVAETPFAVAVDIVLGDLECMIRDLHSGLKARRQVAPLVRAICAAFHGVSAELSFAIDSQWSRRFAASRGELANILKAAIELAPARIRRILRPRAAKDIAPGSVLEAAEVSEAEIQLTLVDACREYSGELGLEASMRGYSELQHDLEAGAKVLLDSLRHATDADRAFRQSQIQAAVKLCRIMFGADYAGLLAKAAEMATQQFSEAERARA
jgi:AraC-like DNA-binding protein